MKKRYYNLFILILFSYACEQVDKSIEEPLPEFYLTSTITEVNETQVSVKGEISLERAVVQDVFGVVYSTSPFPTIENNKLSLSGRKGAFEIIVQNLQPNTAYYFRAFLQANGKIYYSNQLSSTSQYDKRWQRMADFPSELIYSTGILSIEDYPPEFGGASQLSFVSAEKEGIEIRMFYTSNYQNYSLSEQQWFYNTFGPKNTLEFSGLKDLYKIDGGNDRFFVGGGYRINNNLSLPKVYNQNIWFRSSLKFNLPCPIETETMGMTIGKRMFVLATESNGAVYEFTNLDWDKLRNNSFVNQGRVMASGTLTKGYVISESETPNLQGGKLYEFDPDTSLWTLRKSFMGDERVEGLFFSTKEKIYYGLGRNKKTLQALKDIWEYDPKTDNWKPVAVYPGNGNVKLIQTSSKIGNTIYLGMGYQTLINNNNGSESGGVRDFWIFKP